jgi:hypothetical protein
MSLDNLSSAELQNLLMEETKKFTAAMRDKLSQAEKDKLRTRIDEILKLLEERKKTNGFHNHVAKQSE